MARFEFTTLVLAEKNCNMEFNFEEKLKIIKIKFSQLIPVKLMTGTLKQHRNLNMQLWI